MCKNVAAALEIVKHAFNLTDDDKDIILIGAVGKDVKEIDAEVKDMKKRVSNLEKDMTEVKQDLASVKGQISEMHAISKDTSKKIDRLLQSVTVTDPESNIVVGKAVKGLTKNKWFWIGVGVLFVLCIFAGFGVTALFVHPDATATILKAI